MGRGVAKGLAQVDEERCQCDAIANGVGKSPHQVAALASIGATISLVPHNDHLPHGPAGIKLASQHLADVCLQLALRGHAGQSVLLVWRRTKGSHMSRWKRHGAVVQLLLVLLAFLLHTHLENMVADTNLVDWLPGFVGGANACTKPGVANHPLGKQLLQRLTSHWRIKAHDSMDGGAPSKAVCLLSMEGVGGVSTRVRCVCACSAGRWLHVASHARQTTFSA